MYGYIKVAAVSPKIKLADPLANAKTIATAMRDADKQGVGIVVFPELAITGYTCGDLFLQTDLLNAADEALHKLAAETVDVGTLAFIGAPIVATGKLYNCAVAVCGGRVLGVVPKTHIPNYGEFYELRHFTPAPADGIPVTVGGQNTMLTAKQLLDRKSVV